MRWLRFLVYGCFFLSGATGLVYEVVWAKYLATVIGSTTAATTVVLATFMGGLALGNHLLGRQADRVRNRLKFYGWLEIGIGLYCALSLQIIDWGGELYVSLASSSFPPGPLVHFLRLVLAAAALLLPTALMGGTLPVLVRLWVRSLDGTARGVASLYSINSFGAVLGSLLAGFFLIRALGMSLSMLLAAGVNILVGAAAIGLNAFALKNPPPLEGDSPPRAQSAGSDRIMRLALVGAALSGAAAMIYEVGWIRLTAMVWGSSTYSFTVMLAAFISGIAIGSVIAKSIARRRTDLFWIFGLCELCVAFSMLLSIPLYSRLPYSFTHLGSYLVRTPEAFTFYQILVFLCSLAVMILPTVFQGMTLPLISQVASDQLSRLGRSVGRVFSVNTLGTLCGAIFAGLFLMPTIGTRHTLEVGVALTLGTAALVFLGDSGAARVKRMAGVAAGLIAVLGYYVLAPAWDPNVLNSGAFRRKNLQASFDEFRQMVGKGKILYHRDGADCTVAVIQTPRGKDSTQLILVVNGKTDASTEGDLATQLLTAHVPLVLHPRAKDVLVIGLGSGITAGGVLQHEVRRLDLVEISREVVEAQSFFAPFNNQAMLDPRLHLTVDDARTFLRTVPRRYDVIINEPSNPWISGIGALMAEEFFREARRHLNPGGVFVQWIQGYEFSDDLFRTVLATLRKAFPHISGWVSLAGDYYFLCSAEAPGTDLKAAAEEMAKPKVSQSLKRVGISSLATLLSLEMMTSPTLAEFSEATPTNTDNFPVLEYDAPRAFFLGKGVQSTADLDDRLRPHRWNGLLLKKWMDGRRGLSSQEFEEIIAYFERWRSANPLFTQAVLQEWVSAHPDRKEAWQAMARMSGGQDSTQEIQAWERVARLIPEDPDSCRALAQARAHRFLRGVSLVGARDPGPVLAALDQCRPSPQAPRDLLMETKGVFLSRIGRWEEAGHILRETALERLNRMNGKEAADIARLFSLAASAFRLGGQKEKALASAREALAADPGNAQGGFELLQAERMK